LRDNFNNHNPIGIDIILDRWNYDLKEKLPAHDLVLRPLLENCIYSLIYGLNDELYKSNMAILINEKGKHRFDLTKECINGHEYLWNGRERGSIIIILKNDLSIFEKIFENTLNPFEIIYPVSENKNPARKRCKEEMEKGNIGICFGKKTGIEDMQIYTRQHKELLDMAIDISNAKWKAEDNVNLFYLKSLEEIFFNTEKYNNAIKEIFDKTNIEQDCKEYNVWKCRDCIDFLVLNCIRIDKIKNIFDNDYGQIIEYIIAKINEKDIEAYYDTGENVLAKDFLFFFILEYFLVKNEEGKNIKL
jgi:hypothetical protein